MCAAVNVMHNFISVLQKFLNILNRCVIELRMLSQVPQKQKGNQKTLPVRNVSCGFDVY